MVEASESPKLLTRRDVLFGAGAFVGATLISPYGAKAQEFPTCGQLPEDIDPKSDHLLADWQNIIFNDFEVIANSAKTGYELTKYYDLVVPDNKLQVGENQNDWTVSRLSLLYNILDNLPKHTTKSYEGEYVHIALENLPDSSCTCGGLTYHDFDTKSTHDQDQIWMESHLFSEKRSAELNREAMEKTAHEIVGHRYVLDVRHGEALVSFSNVLGEDFSQASKRVQAVLAQHRNDSFSPVQQKGFSILERAFSSVNAFGVELTDYREAVAYLVQMYLYNKDTFYNAISPFLEERVTNALYDILRDEVFLGHEYPYMPDICPS